VDFVAMCDELSMFAIRQGWRVAGFGQFSQWRNAHMRSSPPLINSSPSHTLPWSLKHCKQEEVPMCFGIPYKTAYTHAVSRGRSIRMYTRPVTGSLLYQRWGSLACCSRYRFAWQWTYFCWSASTRLLRL